MYIGREILKNTGNGKLDPSRVFMLSPITSQVPKYLLASDSLTTMVKGSLRAVDGSPVKNGYRKNFENG